MQQKRALHDWEKAECIALKELIEAYNKARPRHQRITQEAAAVALGITQSGFNSYLNGRNALNKEIAARISRLYDIPLQSFSPRLAGEIATLAAAIGGDDTDNQPEHGVMSLGERIAHFRQQAGLSQGELAECCGWKSQSRIGNYEKDLREPTLADLERLAAVLQVSVAELTYGQSTTTEPGRKRLLSAELRAECQAAHDLFLRKKTALKLTQKMLADAAGIAPPSVTQYLNGTNALNARFAAILAKMIEEPVESFSPRLAAEIASMAAVTEHNTTAPAALLLRQYPVRSPIHATTTQSLRHIASTEDAGPHGYWMHVGTPSMTSTTYPSFPEGTPILIRPEGFDLISGKFYIARHKASGETTFKQYVLDAGIGYLVPLNKDYQTVPLDGAWDIIGRAIDAKITGM